MCGIYLSASHPKSTLTARLLSRRGTTSYVERRYQGVLAISSVLSIRGHVFQPVVRNNYLLQYNGEIYNGIELDTLFVAKTVDSIINEHALSISITPPLPTGILDQIGLSDSESTSSETIPDSFFIHSSTDTQIDSRAASTLFTFIESVYTALNSTENEMAICIYTQGRAFFYKDDVGRRSFGIRNKPFAISSVLYDQEIDPLKLYIYDFESNLLISKFKPFTPYTRRLFDSVPGINQFIYNKKYSSIYSYLVGYDTQMNVEMTGIRESVMEDDAEVIREFSRLFSASVSKRCHGNKHAIFFSGGVDSTLIALFIHLTAPETDKIYLINTAFPDGTDRKTGVSSYKQLRMCFPSREFVFVENDLKAKEIKKAQGHLMELISPRSERMHLSIAAVLYFTAMKAKEFSNVAHLGSGADEAFCGYKKYRLCDGRVDRKRMMFDLFSISTHNLGRDDRVIADCSVEARFPFLDTSILEYSLTLSDKWMYNSERGNKRLLREVLRLHGLFEASNTAKKAMQYGSGVSQNEKTLWDD